MAADEEESDPVFKSAPAVVLWVRFEVPPGGGAKSRFREWDLEIVELLPDPVAGEQIDPADYVAHVRVGRAEEEPR